MNKADVPEFEIKKKRVRAYMEKAGYEAVVIGTQNNFAWFTSGGSNRVLTTSDLGFTILVITKEAVYAIAHIMDGPRVFEEELMGLDIEPVFLRWYEESREERAGRITKGLKVLSDIPLPGMEYDISRFHRNLHYPLTESEIEKYQWASARSEEIIRKVADAVTPGMSDYEIEAMFMYEYTRNNFNVGTLMIACDERAEKFRHPVPSGKTIERLGLLHPVVKKWGLCVNITRMIYFGDALPPEISRRYEAACMINAAATASCKTGESYGNILNIEKQMYENTGFGEEWRNHFQGGPTGYIVSDPTMCMTNETLMDNQAYNWYITISGVKVEEVCLNNKGDTRIISLAGQWPTKQYEYKNKRVELPKVLIK